MTGGGGGGGWFSGPAASPYLHTTHKMEGSEQKAVFSSGRVSHWRTGMAMKGGGGGGVVRGRLP